MAPGNINEKKALPIPEHHELSQEQVLWRGTLATEFVITEDPETKVRKLICIEVNGHKSAQKDYNDIESLDSVTKLFTNLRSVRNHNYPKKFEDADDIQASIEEGTFLTGMSDETKKKILQYIDNSIIARTIDRYANANPLNIELETYNKTAMDTNIPESRKPTSYNVFDVINMEDPPNYLIIKPNDGLQGQDIEIIHFKEFKRKIASVLKIINDLREKIIKNGKLGVHEFENLTSFIKYLLSFDNYIIQEYIESTYGKNVPEYLQSNKNTIRYLVDFTVTKSGKIFTEYKRSYVSVLDIKRKVPEIPEYDSDVLNGESKVSVFKLSEDEEAQAKQITEEIILNLTKKFVTK